MVQNMYDVYLQKPLRLKVKIIVSIILMITLVILILLKSNSNFAEFISQNISRHWISIFGRFFSEFDFSVFEFIIAFSVIFTIVTVVRIIMNLKSKTKLKSLNSFLIFIIYVLSIIVIYTTTASFAYNRDDLELDVYLGDIETSELVNISRYFLQDFNYIINNSELLQRDENSNVICPYSYSELAKIIQSEFSRLDSTYFNSYTPKPKPILSSWLMSQMHIEGVAFAPTGEANFNTKIPAYSLPFTIAHELAHTKGIMREDEANLVATYITLTSENEYLRYSAYNKIYPQLLSAIYMLSRDDYAEMSAYITQDVYTERANANDFWEKYSLFADISEFFNDLYLKLSGVEEGTDSYNDNPIIIIPPNQPPEDPPIIIYTFSRTQRLIFNIYYNLQN